MFTLDKHLVSQLVVDNSQPLEADSSPMLDTATLVQATAEIYGFTVDMEKVAALSNDMKKEQSYGPYTGAVLLIRGSSTVDPTYELTTDLGHQSLHLLVFHQSLADQRNRELAEKLLKEEAVELYPGCDIEYLYEALSEVTETQFFSFAQKRALGLPLFEVRFKDSGGFVVEDMGLVGEPIAKSE
jgi:hypothetical protein